MDQISTSDTFHLAAGLKRVHGSYETSGWHGAETCYCQPNENHTAYGLVTDASSTVLARHDWQLPARTLNCSRLCTSSARERGRLWRLAPAGDIFYVDNQGLPDRLFHGQFRIQPYAGTMHHYSLWLGRFGVDVVSVRFCMAGSLMHIWSWAKPGDIRWNCIQLEPMHGNDVTCVKHRASIASWGLQLACIMTALRFFFCHFCWTFDICRRSPTIVRIWT